MSESRSKAAVIAATCAIVAGTVLAASCGKEPAQSGGGGPRPAKRGTAEAARTGPPPNVVLISLDTVRPDHLGCYGYESRTSPNLDSYVRRSVLFKNAYAQAPWTLPSHMSLFTSMLPSHNRVEDINETLADDIPTLAQLLRAHGYNTAALVNNGQMRAHWGFGKGFELWREYEVDTPAGTCENLTAEALRWLTARPQEPFFLFLHYFDPHDPYDPPEPYLKAFGSSVWGMDARTILFDHRFPGRDIKDQRLLKEIVGAYDGEIAWLDHELGKLLGALPQNTLTVIFSDHGEAFEEHGWTTHGASLYEEEVRAALLIGRPGSGGRTVEAPVMLLDVAPTILGLCGIEPPGHYQGHDLRPLMEGRTLADRPILAETKRVLEGRVLKMCITPPWKLVYSLLEGRAELYRLPDEQTDLSGREPEQTHKMLAMVRQWLTVEDFWIVYAAGRGTYDATLTTEGQFAVFIPAGVDMGRDSIRPSPGGQQIALTLYPAGAPKALYFELSPRKAHVSFDCGVDGQQRRDMVFVGTGQNPRSLPFELGQEVSVRSPFIEEPFKAAGEGFHIVHCRGDAAAGRSPRGVTLDEHTIQQLRSLGYLE